MPRILGCGVYYGMAVFCKPPPIWIGQENYSFGVFRESDHPRATDGRFGSKPGEHKAGSGEAGSPHVKMGDSGAIKLKKPKNAKEATAMVEHLTAIHKNAEADAAEAEKLPPNDPRKVRAKLYLHHVAAQYQKALKMARMFAGTPDASGFIPATPANPKNLGV